MTQYHLVSFLPIVGHALYVKRSDESRINSYTVEVFNIGRINKYTDSFAIIDTPNQEVEFSIGNNEKEKFNFWFHYMIISSYSFSKIKHIPYFDDFCINRKC